MKKYLQNKTVARMCNSSESSESNPISRTTIGVFSVGLLCAQLALGQAFETPVLTQESHLVHQKNARQSKVQDDTPLLLPFWDDFSQSGVSPDASRWENSNDVAISPTMGINTLSLNAAVFNGIKATGEAHSTTPFQNGDTDKLTSRMLALSTYSSADNLFLSFFYQKKGNGEIPNDDDGIRLEFMNKDSQWVTNIWKIQGRDVPDTESFHQVLVPVSRTEYFSDKFRFRFVTTGRQTGLFDTWLIDYVYLNKGRNTSDRQYPDRTFTRPLSSPFKFYHSVPIGHFLKNPSSLLDSVGSQYYQSGKNNGNQQYALNANIFFINSDNSKNTTPMQNLTTSRDNDGDFNGEGRALFRRDFRVDSLISIKHLPETAIYAEFRFKLSGIDWKDGKLGNIDLNINDNISNTFVLHNYYAYDDGTAERGAGVNNTGSQLAYKFGINTPDNITAFDIYFPKTIRNVQFGKQVRLKIWSHANGIPAKKLFSKEVSIRKSDVLNEFYRYELNQEIAVADTFYIGWAQLEHTRVYVGLDKNTNSSNRIYFNTTGVWQQNNNDITGSLMLRPVFGKLKTTSSVTASDKHEFESSVRLYPNPASGTIHIQGDYDHVDFLTRNGTKLNVEITKDRTHTEMNLYGLPQGIYLVRITKGNLITTKKIILN